MSVFLQRYEGVEQKKRMGTRQGHPIRFLEPELTPIDWDDISFSLKRTYRYNGHQDTTLADHLLLCILLAYAHGGTDRLAALCGSHDIHEVYIGDFPSPLKQFLPDLKEIEDIWHNRILSALGLGRMTDEESKFVKEIDILALVCECTYHDFNMMWIEEDFAGVTPTKADMRLAMMAFAMPHDRKIEIIRDTIQTAVMGA